MRIQIQPKASLSGTAVFLEVQDHRVISGSEETPHKPAQPGNVESNVSFYDSNLRALERIPARLTADQYAAWNGSVQDDDAYFTQCHAVNFGCIPI